MNTFNVKPYVFERTEFSGDDGRAAGGSPCRGVQPLYQRGYFSNRTGDQYHVLRVRHCHTATVDIRN